MPRGQSHHGEQVVARPSVSPYPYLVSLGYGVLGDACFGDGPRGVPEGAAARGDDAASASDESYRRGEEAAVEAAPSEAAPSEAAPSEAAQSESSSTMVVDAVDTWSCVQGAGAAGGACSG